MNTFLILILYLGLGCKHMMYVSLRCLNWLAIVLVVFLCLTDRDPASETPSCTSVVVPRYGEVRGRVGE